MKKKFFLVMFSILLVLGLLMAGCDFLSLDDSGGGSNSGSGSNPFAGTSWQGLINGESGTFTFTSSTSWKMSGVYGGGSSGTYTYSGNKATLTANGEYAGTATISGNNLKLSWGGIDFTLTKSGSGSGSGSNPFTGTSWRATDGGYAWTLSFTSSSWTLSGSDGASESGSYTYSGNTATCRLDGETLMTATISGNNLDATTYDGSRLTFYRQ